MWQFLRGAGLERFELRRGASSWVLKGLILRVTEDGRAAQSAFEIVCDDPWRTRRATIYLVVSGEYRRLQIEAHNDRWFFGTRELTGVRSCRDIDLGWSPATNTIAIRSLNLPAGGSSGPLMFAWVRFPELSVEPLEQEYRRPTQSSYLYRSHDGVFSAEITCDRHGLVENYATAWKRVDTASV
jgi:hypothetical protein